MDVKSLLEKYCTNDEYGKKIFDKLLFQVERIENEKRVFLEWNKSILNRVSNTFDLFLICVALFTILLFVLQLAICKFLGINLMLNIDIITSVVFIDLIIMFGWWIHIIRKREDVPIVNYTLLSDSEIVYLNDILKVESVKRIKDYQLVIKHDHYYIYDDVYDSLIIVDKYITNKKKGSIYLYRCYQINREKYPNTCDYDLDVVKEYFNVDIETFYSQEELGKEGRKRRNLEEWI